MTDTYDALSKIGARLAVDLINGDAMKQSRKLCTAFDVA